MSNINFWKKHPFGRGNEGTTREYHPPNKRQHPKCKLTTRFTQVSNKDPLKGANE
jgi:hypothetical protein